MEPESPNTMFIWTRHLSLSWARLIHPTQSHPISLRYILILFLNLCLGLPNDLSVFPTKILHTFKFSTYMPHSLYYYYYYSYYYYYLCGYSKKYWWWLKIVNLLIRKCSPVSYFSLPLNSKYFPQHPIFKHPNMRSNSLTCITRNEKL